VSTREGWTTSEIVEGMKVRYSKLEWALLFNVRSTTGASQGRWADALAMNLWPSRGLELHGFEFKASRNDWLHELKHPEKADPIARYCDRWWLVVGHEQVVAKGELPPTWGLLVPRNGRLLVEVEAPKMKAIQLGRGFVASILRSACDARDREIREQSATEIVTF
jgi:hypothetical protein